MQQYRDFVLANKQQVKSLEMSLMVLPMVLPKPEHLGPVIQEATYSVTNLLGVLNDSIIHGKTKHENEIFVTQDPAVHLVRLALTILAHCSALTEVTALTLAGAPARDRAVYLLEFLKAFCRAYLLHRFPGEVICAGGHYESHVPLPPNAPGQPAAQPPATPDTQNWKGRRTGRALPLPQSLQSVSTRLAMSPSLAQGLLRFKLAGEVLHLVRPLLFVVLSKVGSLVAPVALTSHPKHLKEKSWAPYLCSLAVDLAALRCLSLADKQAVDAADFAKQFFALDTLLNTPSFAHDNKELSRRKLLLLFYLLRSPAYESGLGAAVKSASQTFKDTPGLKWLVPIVASQLDFYNQTHFYSSAS